MVRISLQVLRDQIMQASEVRTLGAFFLYVMRKHWRTEHRSEMTGFVSIKSHSGCCEKKRLIEPKAEVRMSVGRLVQSPWKR